VVRAAGSDRVVETQIAAASGERYVLDYVMRIEARDVRTLDVLPAARPANGPLAAPTARDLRINLRAVGSDQPGLLLERRGAVRPRRDAGGARPRPGRGAAVRRGPD
jgi:hypothetical protein